MVAGQITKKVDNDAGKTLWSSVQLVNLKQVAK